MSTPDEFTGERFLPECSGEIWAEHWHRYVFAARHVTGLDVLDIACGEGYGSAMLAGAAKSVTGVDIDPPTVENARRKYSSPRLRFEVGSVSRIPLPDTSFDCVVSFETLEHLAQQEEMLAEFRRVLRPDGFIVISTPNKVEYSDKRNFHNEFHIRELYESQFRDLIGRHFGAQRWYGQRLLFNSAIWPLGSAAGSEKVKAEWITVDERASTLPDPIYFVAIAARSSDRLPATASLATLLADPEDSIYREYEATVARSRALEQIVADRERIVVERDAQIASRNDYQRQMERLIAERDAQLMAQSDRASTMEQLITEREHVIVERDRLLAQSHAMIEASVARSEAAERLVVERDSQLDTVNRRALIAEELIADRERIIVERDAQLSASNEHRQSLERVIAERDAQLEAMNGRMRQAETLIADRERIIVERDAQLASLNERIGNAEALIADRERIIVERDAQLQATNERMTLAERVIEARDGTIATSNVHIHELKRESDLIRQRATDMESLAHACAQKIDSLTRANLDLRSEVVRRASWRWWLSLPARRLSGKVPTTIEGTANDA